VKPGSPILVTLITVVLPERLMFAMRNHSMVAQMRLSPVVSMFLAVAMTVAVGCGGSTDAVPVTGKVSYKGQPLTNGTILLIPEGQGQAPTGMIQPDGTFKLTTYKKDDGAVPGNYKVVVQVFPEEGDAMGLPGMEFGNAKPPIPEKYMDASRTDLTVVIKESDNNLDLQLTD
jgi:hypothetical protein